MQGMTAVGGAGAVPGWVSEPTRSSVSERVEVEGGRIFRLSFQDRELLELTELTGGDEKLVPVTDPAWGRWAADVGAGAFEDEREDHS